MEKNKELRIGIFVCHCGFNIGGVVDVPEVVEYAKTLPNVVCAEENLYACSSAGLNLIKECINKHSLNRVIVASCTPGTHEPLFRNTCEEAGLNKYLFEMVNIREHSSWVHMQHPKEATEKAKDLIRMAVAKASYLKPQIESELEINPSALVIGGGIAGMSVAMSLARQGFNVHLVEKEAELGGMIRRLYKLQPTERDASEVLREAVTAVKANKNIHVHMSTLVKEVEGFIGNFDVKLQEKDSNELEQINVGTMIVATGAEAFKPVGMYGYGEDENVVTQLELERLLKKGELSEPKRVVMIQCVGAREKTGRTYCSRICCMVALNNALLLKKLYPNVEVSILFRDLQTYGEYEDFYREARANFINFIRYDQDRPPKVALKPDGKLIVTVYDSYLSAEIEMDSDLVVLSTPLVQHEDGRKLSPVLKVPLGTDGFFFEAHPKLRPVDFTSEGIYVCGTAHGPKDVPESIAQAYAAASRAAIPMALRRVKAGAIKATVDKDVCVNCDACVVSCIFNAIDAEPFGLPSIIEANCKGCGVCAAECPMAAMQLAHFTDQQIVAAIEALFKPKKLVTSSGSFEPIVLCFACQWCSYGAADLAGVSRIQYPPNVRILRVPCSGRVDVLHVLKAFQNGADGVIVTGCHIGDCHYIDGNLKAKDRIDALKKSLKALDIDPERLEIGFASSSEGHRFAEMMTNFVEKIRRLGPNPLTVKGGVG
ncbi:MAG: FAD-dependent oxidoreductase [Candidatus Bathyarchaeota archaeon]|nr:FAD-dependent oxidoreductase [Candidatus Bathyarchaeota archaeon]MDH5745831.1 FAD-dependent oxidoreductase [Candidatus Bathyarchaeota archaeon]